MRIAEDLFARAAVRVSEAEQNAVNNPRRNCLAADQPRFAL